MDSARVKLGLARTWNANKRVVRTVGTVTAVAGAVAWELGETRWYGFVIGLAVGLLLIFAGCGYFEFDDDENRGDGTAD